MSLSRRLAIVSMLVFAGTARAGDVQLGSATINLVTPAGTCEVDENLPRGKQLADGARRMLQKTDNRLIGYYADCDQLRRSMAGESNVIGDKSQYQVLQSTIDNPVADAAEYMRATCAEIRASGQSYASDDVKRIHELFRSGTYIGSQFLGVLEETPKACHAAMIQRWQERNGDYIAQTAIITFLVVKGRAIYFYRFLPYANEASVPQALARHKPNVAAFLAINGE